MAEKTKAQLEAELEEMRAAKEAAEAEVALVKEAAEANLEEMQKEVELYRLAKENAEASLAPAPSVPAQPETSRENELVPVHLFKDSDKYKDDVFVAVNGKSVQIKRGVTVNVKRKFADVLEQSMAQDTRTASMIEQESNAYKKQAELHGV